VLNPRTPATSAALRARAARDRLIVVPFWMSGDHFLVARGTLADGPPRLWFLDTGLAGAAFTCPETTLVEAGLPRPADTGAEGMGGGGRIKIAPFGIPRVTLGGAEQKNLMGFLGPFPATLERAQGYRISGILSHGFLRAYRVTFDFDAMRVYLEPRRGT
jgi:hypothetical protein